MAKALFAKHAEIEFRLHQFVEGSPWDYEYRLSDNVRHGHLSGRLTKLDAAAEVRKIIDQDLRDQVR
jgi:hypothetical protein